MPENTLFTYFTEESETTLFDFENPWWRRCDKVTIDRYWNGKSVLREKGYHWENLTRVASLWNEESILFYFQCWFNSLNVNREWSTDESVYGLWEKDVVEVFLGPASCDDYFEIEASPLGQWLDVHVLKPRVHVDFSWNSGLKLKVKVDEKERIWRACLALPFQPMVEVLALERTPQAGEAWRLNLYRMAGEEPDREYLSWRPTFTPRPDFHVPSSFGNLIFLAEPKSWP